MTTAAHSPGTEIEHIDIVTYLQTPRNSNLESNPIEASPVSHQPKLHAFGQSLLPYIVSKLPITSLPDHKVSVYVRSYRPGEELHLSLDRKSDKLFNRRRPYFRYVESAKTLEVLCIPGDDMIRHYAALLATFYSASDMPGESKPILYSLPPPRRCYEWLYASNLREMGRVDTVVLGYVELLSRASSSNWESGHGRDDPSHGLFAWQVHQPTQTNLNSFTGPVAFLGCLFNFWGDIAASLVEVLHRFCGVRQVLYIGKAGSLHDDDLPNAVIATGSDSWLDNTCITWDSALRKTLQEDCPTAIQQGSNAYVYSPLEETREWLAEWREQCRWVDCEVSHLALACNKFGISFGYLNIISDNVAKWYEHNLTNERLVVIKEKRHELLMLIESVLDRHLGLPLPQTDLESISAGPNA